MKFTNVLEALVKTLVFAVAVGLLAGLGVVAANKAYAAEDTFRIDSDDGSGYAIVSATIFKIEGANLPDDIFGARVAVFARGNSGDDQPFSTGFYTVSASLCGKNGNIVIMNDDMEPVAARPYTKGGETWVDRVATELCKRIPKA